MEKTYAIIPARCGSKGVPDKNIKLLSGKPLIAYSIMAARKSTFIDRVVVSTDSSKYAEIALEFGAEAPFIRPAEFSTDQSGDPEVMNHALDWFQENNWVEPSLIVHLRPTTPFRDPVILDDAIKHFRKLPVDTALRSVHEMSNTAYKSFEIDNGLLKNTITGDFNLDASNHPRQFYPKTYDCNGYVDILRTSFIKNNTEKIHGNNVYAFVTPFVGEVDTLEEFEYLEFMAAKHPLFYNRLFL